VIPNQNEINFETMRSMLILRHASSDDYNMPTFNMLDDDIQHLLDSEYNHELIKEIVIEDWIHFDPVLPDPEINKIIGELLNIYTKYDRKRESKTDE